MQRKNLAALLALIVLVHPRPSFAYIDPGSGAYVLQSLIAVGGAVIFYVSHPAAMIRKLKEWLSKVSNRS